MNLNPNRLRWERSSRGLDYRQNPASLKLNNPRGFESKLRNDGVMPSINGLGPPG